MELPQIKRSIISKRLKSQNKEKSTTISISVPPFQDTFTQIYNLKGNSHNETLINYTTRMKNYINIFSINRLVRQTKKEISARRQIKGSSTPAPASINKIREYKLSYSPIPYPN